MRGVTDRIGRHGRHIVTTSVCLASCFYSRSALHKPSGRGYLQAAKASRNDAEVRIAPASARSVQRVANLASAWSQVARRLPGAFEEDEMLIIAALKLSLSHLHEAPERLDGRSPSERAVQLASTLADLVTAGLPLDAEAVATGIILEACESGRLDQWTIEDQLGPDVAMLVHDILRVRTAPQRVELYNDVAASSIREWCLAFHDVRANALEVVCRWDELQHMGHLPMYERQLLALEALQVYAPLGHALGLGPVCSGMEDLCFKVLFPQSYNHTNSWLCNMLDEAEDALFRCQQELLMALDTHPEFSSLASSCMIRARMKSLFSIMKKLLRLGNMSEGGRKREEIYDILGMRAVVQPRTDLPLEEAEEAASRACFVVQEVAESMWPPVCDRTKDYISIPKSNGYESLHLTLCLLPGAIPDMNMVEREECGQPCIPESLVRTSAANAPLGGSSDTDLEEDPVISTSSLSVPFLELQIRTKAMDEHAESGDAAHTAYKGGLDSHQARQLQAWTHELQNRLAGRNQVKLMLPGNGAMIDAEPAGGRDSSYNSVNALFRCLDADSSGRVSLENLRALLRDLLPKSAFSQNHQVQGSIGAPPSGQINSIRDVEAWIPEEPPDIEALLLVLQSVSDEAGGGNGAAVGPLYSEGNGEKGMTLPEFARFLKKIVLLNALSRLDKESMGQLQSDS